MTSAQKEALLRALTAEGTECKLVVYGHAAGAELHTILPTQLTAAFINEMVKASDE